MHTKVLVILNTVILYGPLIPGIDLLLLTRLQLQYTMSQGCHVVVTTTLLVD